MRRKPSQLTFFSPPRSEYGGTLLNTRAGRAGPRPVDTRHTLHLVLRSSQATGTQSFLRYRQSIRDIFARFGKRYGIRVLNLANVGNHLHLQIQVSNRYLYAPFIRATTGAIAMKVTGASRWANKGRPNQARSAPPRAAPSARDSRTPPGARSQSGAGPGSPSPRSSRLKFWDVRPWSRIVKSYRALLNLRDYLAINELQGQGLGRAEARWIITGRFAWDLRGPP